MFSPSSCGVLETKSKTTVQPGSFGPVKGASSDPITAGALYSRWAEFIKPNDIVVTETGTSSIGNGVCTPAEGREVLQPEFVGCDWMGDARGFWGSSRGASTVVSCLITGEGSHQLTAQEIAQFGRRGLKPIVFVLNNSGYLIERLLCENPDFSYNDLAQWRYSELPNALGCTTGLRRASLHAENSIRPLKPRLRATEAPTSRL